MTEVYIFKLVTGESVIATLINADKKSYTLDKPMIINESVDENSSQTAIILSQYNAFDKHQISIVNKNHVLSVSNVIEEMVEYYEKSIRFNEQIITPKMKKTLTLVNKQINEYLNEYETEVFLDNDLINHKSSNSIH